MRIIKTEIRIQLLDFDELTAGEQTLISRACKVRLNAQAPYSHYWMGCSVMTPWGNFFDGCNVERASWTQTTHAEQNALDNMIAVLGPHRIAGIAVVGAPEGKEIPWPLPLNDLKDLPPDLSPADFCPSCGHCLQNIAENCFDESGQFDPTIKLLNYSENQKIIYRTTIGNAYPMPFLPQYLGINYAKDQRAKNHK
ncbi:MAG: hypothetical protein HYT65_00810 [Candidatus Yanofskybacteria bacterium]|nr:hypothetical protein [Candidatus Yanofskybacteria bacterium]